MPHHVNPTAADRTFHAAYNFIPLPDQVLSVADDPAFLRDLDGEKAKIWAIHDRFVPETLSGWIDLEITAETPLYIRCGVAPERARDPEARTNPHRQEFYHHGEPAQGDPHPWIPGSSLRGMVRGLVEIVSFGKMQWFSGAQTPKRLAYRGVADSSSMGRYYREQLKRQNLRGGYLHVDDGRWFIRPATTFEGSSFVRVEYDNVDSAIGGPDLHDWRPVFVRPPHAEDARLEFPVTDVVRSAEAPGLVPAALVMSGHITGKHPKHMHCAIYQADANAQPIEITEQMRRTYVDDRDSIRGTPPRSLGEEGDPLFYLMIDNRLIFFGPTLMFRLPYERTIGDFVPAALRNSVDVDLAEAMFGRVGESTIKGRVRFEDARATAATFMDGDRGRRSPKILGAPKPTSFQLYLEQDRPDDPHSLRHWGSDPRTTKIRGWKRYWHRPTAGDSERFEAELKPDGTQYTIIRPVKAGSRFDGRIRFDNLLPMELGALLFVLDLPNSLRHHLGMGKARGLGSVNIRPSLTLIDRRDRYARMFGVHGEVEESFIAREQTDTTAKTAREQFTRRVAVFAHSRESDLWRLPRVALLGAMLRWNGAPPLDRITSPEVGPAWRSRAVLPTPDAVAGIEMPEEFRPPDMNPGSSIEVRLRADKTHKGGPRFDVVGSDLIAVLDPKSDALPPGLAAGDTLKLVVRSGGKTPQLAWVDPAAPPPSPPKRGPANQQKPRGRR